MQEAPPIVIVKIIQDVVAATSNVVATKVGGTLDYQPGRSSQIKAELQKISEAISQSVRAGRYPLIALFQDIPEQMGTGYDVVVTIPKISIAMLTVDTNPVLKRYEDTFPKLYIIYREFLRQLTRHKNIVAGDPNAIVHTKLDRPGDKPEVTGFNDYLDAIELSNLQLTFRSLNKCKSL
jgi:hypothetical protein